MLFGKANVFHSDSTIRLVFPSLGIFCVSSLWYLRVKEDSKQDFTWKFVDNVFQLDLIWLCFFMFWNVINGLGSSSLMHKYYGEVILAMHLTKVAWRLKQAFYNRDTNR